MWGAFAFTAKTAVFSVFFFFCFLFFFAYNTAEQVISHELVTYSTKLIHTLESFQVFKQANIIMNNGIQSSQ